MTNAAHTPTPWDCWDMDEFGWHVFAVKFGGREKGQDCRLSIAAVRHGRSHIEAKDNYWEQVANAKFIVRAVNSHDDLLAALKLARECIAYCRKNHKDAQSGEGFPAEMILDAAITKAEGQS